MLIRNTKEGEHTYNIRSRSFFILIHIYDTPYYNMFGCEVNEETFPFDTKRKENTKI